MDLLSIKGNTDKLSGSLLKSGLSKAKIQNHHSGHLEVSEKPYTEKDSVFVSIWGSNSAAQGLMKSLHPLEPCSKAVDIAKTSIQKKNIDAISASTGTKDSSFHHIVGITPLERIALSSKRQESSQIPPSLIMRIEGSDIRAPQKDLRHETGR
ncbi:unnamed protein product [Phytomonas sp. Hart1]|nr:unnamed protein product [Phytomonas sp. Hart1]|eukprot:CCW69201.1 unnamed protein product [Phytomonas sp. isolate Hart1]